jgi:hypothetical protein
MGWQSWSSKIVDPEISRFRKQTRTFIGWSERKVLKTFGPPDDVFKDYHEILDDTGQVMWKPDKSLFYLTLLPHVFVCFGFYKGKVGRVIYYPKWKRCPPGMKVRLGNRYAPR